jgi:hypothetical protein
MNRLDQDPMEFSPCPATRDPSGARRSIARVTNLCLPDKPHPSSITIDVEADSPGDEASTLKQVLLCASSALLRLARTQMEVFVVREPKPDAPAAASHISPWDFLEPAIRVDRAHPARVEAHRRLPERGNASSLPRQDHSNGRSPKRAKVTRRKKLCIPVAREDKAKA